MAAEPFRLADLTIATPITEDKGSTKGLPTAYFQRFIQDMNRRIAAAIVDLQTINDKFAAQLLLIEAAQLTADQAVDDAAAAADLALQYSIQLGYGQYGLSTVSPDGSGDVFISHAYPSTGFGTPTLGACSANAASTAYVHPQLIAVDATSLTLRLFDAAGSPLTTGSYQVAWRVGAA